MDDYIGNFLNSLEKNTNATTSTRTLNQDLTMIDNYCSDNTKESHRFLHSVMTARHQLIQDHHFYICRTSSVASSVPSNMIKKHVDDAFITLELKPNYKNGEMVLAGRPVESHDFRLFLNNIINDYKK